MYAAFALLGQRLGLCDATWAVQLLRRIEPYRTIQRPQRTGSQGICDLCAGQAVEGIYFICKTVELSILSTSLPVSNTHQADHRMRLTRLYRPSTVCLLAAVSGFPVSQRFCPAAFCYTCTPTFLVLEANFGTDPK